MKYSQLIGCIAVVILIAVGYLPWSYIPEKNIMITGMSAPNTVYGKPALMHIVLGVILIFLFIIPKIWAKRANIIISAINLAWSVRNYILLSTCYMGECPQRKSGLFISFFLCIIILIMTFIPDIKKWEKSNL